MDELGEGHRELAQLYLDADNRAIAAMRGLKVTTDTQYGQYQLPGGEAYRDRCG
jgi:hypothetical protein